MLSYWCVITFACDFCPRHLHKSEDAIVWPCCRSHTGPGVKWCTVTTHAHFGFSGCNPAAEECLLSCNQLGWGLGYLWATVMAGWSLVSRAGSTISVLVSRLKGWRVK